MSQYGAAMRQRTGRRGAAHLDTDAPSAQHGAGWLTGRDLRLQLVRGSQGARVIGQSRRIQTAMMASPIIPPPSAVSLDDARGGGESMQHGGGFLGRQPHYATVIAQIGEHHRDLPALRIDRAGRLMEAILPPPAPASSSPIAVDRSRSNRCGHIRQQQYFNRATPWIGPVDLCGASPKPGMQGKHGGSEHAPPWWHRERSPSCE
jgi:hypothetical protein